VSYKQVAEHYSFTVCCTRALWDDGVPFVVGSTAPLNYLLSPVKVSHSDPYQLPIGKATRYGRDFILYCVFKKF